MRALPLREPNEDQSEGLQLPLRLAYEAEGVHVPRRPQACHRAGRLQARDHPKFHGKNSAIKIATKFFPTFVIVLHLTLECAVALKKWCFPWQAVSFYVFVTANVEKL